MASHNYDDSRVKDYHDQRLVQYIEAYFQPFVTSDAEGLRKFQTEHYTMSDISLGVVRASRDDYYNINKGFSSLASEPSVVALSLEGSSQPGSHSIMECLISFKLKVDPPPLDSLPPGAKAGDTVQIIQLSVIWWAEEGKVLREYEYGRLVWKDFDLRQFDKAQ